MMRDDSICAQAGIPDTHSTAADQPKYVNHVRLEASKISRRTNDVTKRFLKGWWCELGDPIVLATRS